MGAVTSCCIYFSGLRFRFRFPSPVELPKELTDLQCDDTDEVDEEFEICLITSPIPLEEKPLNSHIGTEIYLTDKGWLRIYSPLTAANGCQVACLLCPDGNNKLFYPASKWGHYSKSLHLLHLIGGEALLIKYDAFLLHSAVVMVNGKMVLFSGPSGAGKSTQAALWAAHRNAEVINGDRCVVMRREDGFYGGGSPWCGTSDIRRPEMAPIAGIFLVEQAEENTLNRLGKEAFLPLFSQTTVNSWDPAFMAALTGLFDGLLREIPVYRLRCRPDKEAVDLVYDTLF